MKFLSGPRERLKERTEKMDVMDLTERAEKLDFKLALNMTVDQLARSFYLVTGTPGTN